MPSWKDFSRLGVHSGRSVKLEDVRTFDDENQQYSIKQVTPERMAELQSKFTVE